MRPKHAHAVYYFYTFTPDKPLPFSLLPLSAAFFSKKSLTTSQDIVKIYRKIAQVLYRQQQKTAILLSPEKQSIPA